jgi:uncharacterized protein (TIGR00255 family)
MLRSMTGFGSAQGRVEAVEYSVEIRSVNNRYFKSVIKLPEHWANLESEIEKLLRAKLSRGTVVLTLRMKLPEEKAVYKLNVAAMMAYLEQLGPMLVDANPVLRVDLGQLTQLPGVCEPPELNELMEKSRDGLMALVSESLDQLMVMRQKEGQLLKADLSGLCEVLEKNLIEVAARAPQVVKDYQQRLSDRVAELTNAGKIDIDEDNLAREVALFAERCDIAEEIARLSGHIKHFRQAMSSPEPGGRKLDFIAQEMLREANTIASKANNAEIARAVVEMKTAIDRIKEQVQNAE